MKDFKNSKFSTSLYPILVLIVIGSEVDFAMASIHFATRSGSAIKHAPNLFF